ncbi:hypothetical protein BpHYR1_026524 [Brachionus plicatilis]|uniref:Uncharacterized protein n=1 Tax=Brachionus plicatilis TaxID=10195 RepID=A0A3M7QTX1_BRAPC|nr:hypothetical protein BpHYR1_026524 [Brachionus plicatilis]
MLRHSHTGDLMVDNLFFKYYALCNSSGPDEVLSIVISFSFSNFEFLFAFNFTSPYGGNIQDLNSPKVNYT